MIEQLSKRIQQDLEVDIRLADVVALMVLAYKAQSKPTGSDLPLDYAWQFIQQHQEDLPSDLNVTVDLLEDALAWLESKDLAKELSARQTVSLDNKNIFSGRTIVFWRQFQRDYLT